VVASAVATLEQQTQQNPTLTMVLRGGSIPLVSVRNH
jgi:hypothetical protein